MLFGICRILLGSESGRRRDLAWLFFYVGILVFLELGHLNIAPVLHLIADNETVFIQVLQHIVHIGHRHIIVAEDVFLQSKRSILKAACSIRLAPQADE